MRGGGGVMCKTHHPSSGSPKLCLLKCLRARVDFISIPCIHCPNFWLPRMWFFGRRKRQREISKIKNNKNDIGCAPFIRHTYDANAVT